MSLWGWRPPPLLRASWRVGPEQGRTGAGRGSARRWRVRGRTALAPWIGPPLRVGGGPDAGTDAVGAVAGLGASPGCRGTGAPRASDRALAEARPRRRPGGYTEQNDGLARR